MLLIHYVLTCTISQAEFYISFQTASGSVKYAIQVPPGVPIPGCITSAAPIKLNLTLLAW